MAGSEARCALAIACPSISRSVQGPGHRVSGGRFVQRRVRSATLHDKKDLRGLVSRATAAAWLFASGGVTSYCLRCRRFLACYSWRGDEAATFGRAGGGRWVARSRSCGVSVFHDVMASMVRCCGSGGVTQHRLWPESDGRGGRCAMLQMKILSVFGWRWQRRRRWASFPSLEAC